jgi:hypothetical protein
MLEIGKKLKSSGTGRIITIVNSSDDFIYFTWDDQKKMLPEKEELIVCQWHNEDDKLSRWQDYFKEI